MLPMMASAKRSRSARVTGCWALSSGIVRVPHCIQVAYTNVGHPGEAGLSGAPPVAAGCGRFRICFIRAGRSFSAARQFTISSGSLITFF